jgi:hypothetical protein
MSVKGKHPRARFRYIHDISLSTGPLASQNSVHAASLCAAPSLFAPTSPVLSRALHGSCRAAGLPSADLLGKSDPMVILTEKTPAPRANGANGANQVQPVLANGEEHESSSDDGGGGGIGGDPAGNGGTLSGVSGRAGGRSGGARMVSGRGWRYVGQTEWVADDNDPVFKRPLELAFPSPTSQFRFTVVDIDDPNNIPTRWDMSAAAAAAADLLGTADVAAEALVAAAGSGAPLTVPLRAARGGAAAGAGTLTVKAAAVLGAERACFAVRTTGAGNYIGRRHVLLFNTERSRNRWAAAVERARARARRDRAMENGLLLSLQEPIRRLYVHQITQSTVTPLMHTQTHAKAQALNRRACAGACA